MSHLHDVECKTKLISNELSRRLSINYVLLMDEFHISIRNDLGTFIGRCPVHSGKVHDEFSMTIGKDDVLKRWECKTYRCESHFAPTGFGLLRGLLSRTRFDWHPVDNADSMCSIDDSIRASCDILNVRPSEIEEYLWPWLYR